MKIYVDLKRNASISDYLCDGLIIPSKEFSCYNDDCYSIDEIFLFRDLVKKNNKEVILNIDRIIMEDDLNELLCYLEKVYLEFDYFIFSDMSIRYFFEEKGLSDKLIYDPKTLVASYNELSINTLNNIQVILANELSFSEIKEISEKSIINLEVFGYHQMFYSKRKLISLYKEYFKLDDELKGKKLLLKEELRNEFYPIYESDKGTFIYTDYLFCMFSELLEIKDKIGFIKLNGMFLKESDYQMITSIYYRLVNGEDCDMLFEKLKIICNNLSKGFLLNKSVLLKVNEND